MIRSALRYLDSAWSVLTPQDRRTLLVSLLALASGAEYLTAVYRLPTLRNLGVTYTFALSFAVLGPVALALVACSAGRLSWVSVPPLMLLGIFIGLVIDLALHPNPDRNLFPLEVVFMSVFLAPAVVTGSVIGWFVKRWAERREQSAR
jgi:hypothetical protein